MCLVGAASVLCSIFWKAGAHISCTPREPTYTTGSAAQHSRNMIVYYMGNLYTAPAGNARKGEADALPFLDRMATLMPTIR